MLRAALVSRDLGILHVACAKNTINLMTEIAPSDSTDTTLDPSKRILDSYHLNSVIGHENTIEWFSQLLIEYHIYVPPDAHGEFDHINIKSASFFRWSLC